MLPVLHVERDADANRTWVIVDLHAVCMCYLSVAQTEGCPRQTDDKRRQKEREREILAQVSAPPPFGGLECLPLLGLQGLPWIVGGVWNEHVRA